jgi:hypothetical protein
VFNKWVKAPRPVDLAIGTEPPRAAAARTRDKLQATVGRGIEMSDIVERLRAQAADVPITPDAAVEIDEIVDILMNM